MNLDVLWKSECIGVFCVFFFLRCVGGCFGYKLVKKFINDC